jgi:hypothetical protein
VLEDLMKEFYTKKIEFTFIKLNENCNKMIQFMQRNHPDLVITDLAQALKTKSSEEVTRLFVESASYILRATVAGKEGAAKKKSAKKGESLWDPSKLQVGDWFSCISYLKVEQVDGTKIRVKNHRGGEWFIS